MTYGTSLLSFLALAMVVAGCGSTPMRTASQPSGPGTVYVYSPVTGQTYAMYCSGSAPVVCAGGKNASVYIS